MTLELYDYAIILQPKVNKDGEVVEKGELVKRDSILARDQEQATLIAGRAIPDEYMDRLDRLTIGVRPF